MKHQITFKKQLRPILVPIIASVVFSLFYIELFITAWYNGLLLFSIVVYIGFLVYSLIIPIYIHRNYLKYDKGKLLELDFNKKHFNLKKDKQVLANYNFDEIKRIEVHQSAGYKQRLVNWCSWAAYYHYKFIFNNGEVAYLSRLVIRNLEKEFESDKIEYFNYVILLIPLGWFRLPKY